MAMDKNEYLKNWRKLHPNYDKEYREKNIEKLREKEKKRSETPIGRAHYLLQAYNQKDKLHRRGKGDLTAQWIVENIFSKPCTHCGKEGWNVIGCNRLNNDLPHTMDNVEPCCKECNDKLQNLAQNKRVYQYTLDGVLVKVWESIKECVENGFARNCVWRACKGEYYCNKRKKMIHTDIYKGYRWSYTPL